MTSALPNPFMTYQPSRQAMIDAVCLAAVEDALDPLPVFLTGPRVDPDRGHDRSILPGRLPSLSLILRELSELVHPLDVEGRRP